VQLASYCQVCLFFLGFLEISPARFCSFSSDTPSPRYPPMLGRDSPFNPPHPSFFTRFLPSPLETNIASFNSSHTPLSFHHYPPPLRYLFKPWFGCFPRHLISGRCPEVPSPAPPPSRPRYPTQDFQLLFMHFLRSQKPISTHETSISLGQRSFPPLRHVCPKSLTFQRAAGILHYPHF